MECFRCSVFAYLFLVFSFVISAIFLSSFNHQNHLSNFAPPFVVFSTIKDKNTNITSSPSPPPVLEFFSNLTSVNESSNATVQSSAFKLPLLKEFCSLEKLERGLARARASIQKAILSRNYSATKREIFVPEGSIYWNPHAFHQSHIEMLKRFKVWTYEEGEPPLFHDGPMSLIYSIEGHFMAEIDNSSQFSALHPDEAHVFMLPISVTHIVQFLYNPLTTYSLDQLLRVTVDYTNIIARRYPYWNRSRGADHFLLSCHDWAPYISREKSGKELFKNLIRALCNANRSEEFEPERDVSIPEMNLQGFNPRSAVLGQHPNHRSILAFFAGRPHGRIREILLEHWKDKDEEVQVHGYLPKGLDYHGLMGRSKFCLCPSGYEVASPRLVESINSGCVPVIISDYYQLPFSDVLDWTKFSLHIPPKRIPEIKTILKAVSHTKYLKLQKRVIKVQRHFVLNRPAKPFDVLHMILHSVWLRRLNIKLSPQ